MHFHERGARICMLRSKEYRTENKYSQYIVIANEGDFLSLRMYVFTQPLRTSKMQHKVNFKRNLAGLNSEIPFSTSCHYKVNKTCLPYYLPLDG